MQLKRGKKKRRIAKAKVISEGSLQAEGLRQARPASVTQSSREPPLLVALRGLVSAHKPLVSHSQGDLGKPSVVQAWIHRTKANKVAVPHPRAEPSLPGMSFAWLWQSLTFCHLAGTTVPFRPLSGKCCSLSLESPTAGFRLLFKIDLKMRVLCHSDAESNGS